MSRHYVVAIAFVVLLAGCAAHPPAPASDAAPETHHWLDDKWEQLAAKDPQGARDYARNFLKFLSENYYGHGKIREGDDIAAALATRRVDTLPLRVLPGYVDGVAASAGERPGVTLSCVTVGDLTDCEGD